MTIIYAPPSPSHGTRANLVYKPAPCSTGTGDDLLRHIESGLVGVIERGPAAPNYDDPQVFLEVAVDALSAGDSAISDALQFSNHNSEYALITGDKAVCLKHMPPGAFTGLMREFMLAMYATDNNLMRWQVESGGTGFAESVAISSITLIWGTATTTPVPSMCMRTQPALISTF
jgi:hypothetical protein